MHWPRCSVAQTWRRRYKAGLARQHWSSGQGKWGRAASWVPSLGRGRIQPLGQVLTPSPSPGGLDSAAQDCTIGFGSTTLSSSVRAAVHYLRKGFFSPLSLGSTSKPQAGYGASVSAYRFQLRIRIANCLPFLLSKPYPCVAFSTHMYCTAVLYKLTQTYRVMKI